VRYTRYNYKPPRKNNNFTMVIILTLIAAIALGTIFSKLLPKSNSANTGVEDKADKVGVEKESGVSKDSVDVTKVIAETNIKDYIAIQCGVFSNKENALVLKNSLMEFGTPFIIEEDNLNRVLFGIYPKIGIDNITKELKDRKIEYVKINFQLIGRDVTSAQINEMINADIEILNKLSEKDTKSVQTVEFKKWLNSLEGAEEKSSKYNAMTEIKTYLNAMPEELKKEKTENEYIYIYKFIKKLLKI
jgi:hypothetical protein